MNKQQFLGMAGAYLIRALARTQRFVTDDPHGQLVPTGRPRIFAFWHNRLMMMPWLYRHYFPNAAVTVMISRSRDGQLIAEICRRFRIGAVRGSTRRGGDAALREIGRIVATGNDAAITPDGPRGPLYVVQPGIVRLARMTGAPVVPATWNPSRRRTLSSWDEFVVPMPFARCEVRIGAPIPPDFAPGDDDAFVACLQQRFEELVVDP